jgi:hypothetical protein
VALLFLSAQLSLERERDVSTENVQSPDVRNTAIHSVPRKHTRGGQG